MFSFERLVHEKTVPASQTRFTYLNLERTEPELNTQDHTYGSSTSVSVSFPFLWLCPIPGDVRVNIHNCIIKAQLNSQTAIAQQFSVFLQLKKAYWPTVVLLLECLGFSFCNVFEFLSKLGWCYNLYRTFSISSMLIRNWLLSNHQVTYSSHLLYTHGCHLYKERLNIHIRICFSLLSQFAETRV